MTSVAIPQTGQDAGPSRQHVGIACGLAAALIWGGYLAVSRHGIAAGLSAGDMAFVRYLTSGAIMLPWLLRHSPRSLAGVGWARGIVISVLVGPLFVLVGASGFHFAPLAHAAVMQLGTLTLASAVLAWLIIAERPSPQRLVGLAILIVGLAVTAGPSILEGGSDAWVGDALFALAGAMWALFTVLQRRWTISPIAATAIVSVLGAAIYSPIYIAIKGMEAIGRARPAIILEQAIVLGLLSGVVAMFAFGRAVQILGPSRAALFPALAPAVAILLGIPLTGDVPDALQTAGLAILTTGLLIAVRQPHPTQPNAPQHNGTKP